MPAPATSAAYRISQGMRLLNIHQAAAVCGVSRRTIYNWIASGLPVERRDGRTFLAVDTVRAYQQRCRATTRAAQQARAQSRTAAGHYR